MMARTGSVLKNAARWPPQVNQDDAPTASRPGTAAQPDSCMARGGTGRDTADVQAPREPTRSIVYPPRPARPSETRRDRETCVVWFITVQQRADPGLRTSRVVSLSPQRATVSG